MAQFAIPAWEHIYLREIYSDGTLDRQRIQLPYVNLANAKPPIIARYLEKNIAREVILIKDLSTIIDSGQPTPSVAEAHGVFARPTGQCCPIWVFHDSEDVDMEPPYCMDIFDLEKYTRLKVNACTVCWVPHLQDSDGNFITLLDGPLKSTKRKGLGIRLLIQEPGNPAATKLAWKSVMDLGKTCQELDSNTKRIVFGEQLAALQAWVPWNSKYSSELPMGAMQQLVRCLPSGSVQEQRAEMHSRFATFSRILLSECPIVSMAQLEDLEKYATSLLAKSNPSEDLAQVMVLLVIGISSFHDDVCQDYGAIIKQLDILLIEPSPFKDRIHVISLVWATWLLKMTENHDKAKVHLGRAKALLGAIPIGNRAAQYREIQRSTLRLEEALKKSY